MENHNPFESIQNMYNLCQLDKLHNEFYFATIPSAIFPDVFDYSRGFLSLEIIINHLPNTTQYQAFATVRSIDDSGVTISNNPNTKDKIDISFNKIVSYMGKCLKDMSFPDRKKLEQDLIEMGFYMYYW